MAFKRLDSSSEKHKKQINTHNKNIKLIKQASWVFVDIIYKIHSV